MDPFEMNQFLVAGIIVIFSTVIVWGISKITRAKSKLPTWVDKEPPIMLVPRPEHTPEPIPEPVIIFTERSPAKTYGNVDKRWVKSLFPTPPANRWARRRQAATQRN